MKKKSWNSGLTKETSEKVKLMGIKTGLSNKGKKGHIAWNKDLTIENNPIIKKISEKIRLTYQRKGYKNIIDNRGYKRVITPLNHPYGLKHRYTTYILEHRLVMEKHLGRYLKKDEIIHHIDGNTLNNAIENLYLTTQPKHIAEHNSKRVWKEENKLKHKLKSLNIKRNKLGRFSI